MGKLTEARVRTTKATDKDQWLNDGEVYTCASTRVDQRSGLYAANDTAKDRSLHLIPAPP